MGNVDFMSERREDMNKAALVLYYSQMDEDNRKFYKKSVYQFLATLSRDYPGFLIWYNQLFTRYELKAGREIAVLLSDERIAGVSIMKLSARERKICTMRVEKNFRGRGYGRLLMENAFAYLGTDTPFFTIDSRRSIQFSHLFKYYGFRAEEQKNNYYRWFASELVYNGFLPGRNFWTNKIKTDKWDGELRKLIWSGYNLPDFGCPGMYAGTGASLWDGL